MSPHYCHLDYFRSAQLQKLIEPHIDTVKEKAIWTELTGLRKAYLAARDKTVELKKQGKDAEASAMVDQVFTPAAKPYSAKIQELQQTERDQINQTAADIQQVYLASRNLMLALALALALLMVLFVIVCAWVLTTRCPWRRRCWWRAASPAAI